MGWLSGPKLGFEGANKRQTSSKTAKMKGTAGKGTVSQVPESELKKGKARVSRLTKDLKAAEQRAKNRGFDKKALDEVARLAGQLQQAAKGYGGSQADVDRARQAVKDVNRGAERAVRQAAAAQKRADKHMTQQQRLMREAGLG